MIVLDEVPGSPNWIDLACHDLAATAEFYGALFGWRLAPPDDRPEQDGDQPERYGRFTLYGARVAGVCQLEAPNARAGWTVYFHSADIDVTATAAVRAGGQIASGPAEAATAGRRCLLLDNTGATFAVSQLRDGDGIQVANTDGSLCWSELYTTDPVAAAAFYHSVFGWIVDDVPMPSQSNYALARPSGTGHEAVHAGIIGMSQPMRAAGLAPAWEPHFQVADCDRIAAAAVGAGGGVSVEPADVPLLGRVARLTDPSGAPFAIVAGARVSAAPQPDVPHMWLI